MAGTSLLDASGLAQPTSQFDASAIDANLKAITAVQSSWRLPQLPPEVSLDLAKQPGVTPDHLNNLLYGIESDYHGDQSQAPPPLYVAPSLPDFSTYDKARVIVSGIATNKPPTVVDSNAVERWKMDAIDKGYLTPPTDGVINNSWQPEFETIRKSMAYDDYNKAARGNHPGAMSFQSITNQIGKWASPTGLLRAATNLDLFWDFGAVGKEFNTWGDKWRKVGKSKNPFDFAKNLVDAITGPIDDIVMPIANWALMASGVSEAYNFAKIAYSTGEAVAGAEAVSGLYKAEGFAKFVGGGYDAANDVARMREASTLALRLGKSENQVVSGVGDAMKFWRDLRPVATSKKLIQTGMKLGIASQAENLLPGYQGGHSAAELAPVSKILTWSETNPLFVYGSGVAELFLTPYSTFRPGTFSSGGKDAVAFVGRHLGTTAGKAVLGGVLGAGAGALLGNDTGDVLKGAGFGAAGLAAVPGVGKGLGQAAAEADSVLLLRKIMPKAVGHVGDFLQMTSWKPLGDNQQLSMAFHMGMLNHLGGTPEALATYQKAFDEKGFLGAFAQHLGVDEETAAASMAYVMTAAAIDHVAASQANGQHLGDLYFTAKNKLIAQIRPFDLENVGAHTLDEVAWNAARGVHGEKKEFASLRDTFTADPAKALEFANSHNRQAQETLQQLLSVEASPDLNPELASRIYGWGGMDAPARAAVIQNYLPQVMDTFGNWPQFSARTSEIRQLLHEGLLDHAVFDTYHLPSGKELATVPPKAARNALPTTPQEVSQGVNDLLFRTPGTDVNKVVSNGKLDVLARAADPSIGRFTVMRANTADKGQVLALQGGLKELMSMHEIALPKSSVLAEATAANGELTELTKAQFNGVIGQYVKGNSSIKDLRKLYYYAKREGVSMGDMKPYLDDAINTAVNDPRLTDWLGLPTVQHGPPGKGESVGAVLSGREALKQRIADLDRKATHTAARIDGEKLLAGLGEGTPEYARVKNHLDSLDRDGYKLVHGVEYMMPDDLAHHAPIFDDITRRHLNAVTLGNFFKGRLPEIARANESRRHFGIIQDELSKLNLSTPLNEQDSRNLLEDMTSILHDRQSLSEQVRTESALGTWAGKRIDAVRNNLAPMSMADLGRTDWKNVVAKLKPVYGEEVANAAPKMLRRMRNTEFQDVGLYAIEAKLRTQNQFASALKVLSGTEHGEGFLAHGKTARWVGAGAGAIYGAQTDDNNLTGALKGAAIGAVAGTVAQGSLSPLFAKAEKAFDSASWFRYGYLADNLAAVRDTMRFTLSPFFDLSRMAKSQELGQTAAPLRNDLGERIVMPLNSSPGALKKTWVKQGLSKEAADQKFETTVQRFQALSRGDKGAFEHDFVSADNLSNYFQQVGILGHNPTEWMVTGFQHLVDQGVNPERAYQAARSMYQYGTGAGRSAAEMSANFIFFPFSFEKKAYSYLAKYISDDMSRAIVLHDAMKGYEILNQKYNLSQMWKEHLPALDKLQQLNMFAYGASLGRLGGLNRTFIEPIANMAANLHGKSEFVPGIFNLFNPQGVSVRSAADAVEVKKLTRSLLPAINDINYLLTDAADQGHVLFSASHQVRAADARDGWKAWNDYKRQFTADLTQHGWTQADLNKPWLAQTKMAYETKRVEIGNQYPGWKDSRLKVAEQSASKQIELQDKLDRMAAGTPTLTDKMTFEFSQAVKQVKADIKLRGGLDMTDASTDQWQQLHDLAAQFADQSSEWRNVYGKFFQRELGPIEAQVTL